MIDRNAVIAAALQTDDISTITDQGALFFRNFALSRARIWAPGANPSNMRWCSVFKPHAPHPALFEFIQPFLEKPTIRALILSSRQKQRLPLEALQPMLQHRAIVFVQDIVGYMDEVVGLMPITCKEHMANPFGMIGWPRGSVSPRMCAASKSSRWRNRQTAHWTAYARTPCAGRH